MSTTSAAHDLSTDSATGLTPEDLRRAAIVACSYADGPEDARELLEALGLLDDLRGVARLAG